MKKLLIKVICILTMTMLFLTGCSQRKNSSTPDEVKPTMSVINLTATEETRDIVRATIAPTEGEADIVYRCPRETQPLETTAELEEETYVEEEETEAPEEEKIEEPIEEETDAPGPTEAKHNSSCIYSPAEFLAMGVINWGGWTWTYYSENILPGEDLYLPGRHTDEDGYICDENDYLCVASSVLSRGEIVDTPFGKQGKIYDCGCASHILDIYVSW